MLGLFRRPWFTGLLVHSKLIPMRLLIVTQKVDRNDPVLGFFHRWIIEFAKKFESIIVICLEMGEHDLPPNVKVLSLGKEERQDRLQYLIHFFWHIQHERKNYDAVLVHMNQEYLLLAGWLWRVWGKKVTMWRNHHAGSLLTDIAAAFCHKVFCTSTFSYTAKYKKTELMPVGVDTSIFKPDPKVRAEHGTILSLGRIATTKRIEVLLESLGTLSVRNMPFRTSIYGDALPQAADYYESLKKRAAEADLAGKVIFHPGIPNHQAPVIYSSHEIFVNLSSSGMYDKTIFEAMACGSLPVVSNRNLEKQIDPALFFKEGDAADLAGKLGELLSMDKAHRDELRRSLAGLAETKHSLSALAQALKRAIESIR